MIVGVSGGYNETLDESADGCVDGYLALYCL